MGAAIANHLIIPNQRTKQFRAQGVGAKKEPLGLAIVRYAIRFPGRGYAGRALAYSCSSGCLRCSAQTVWGHGCGRQPRYRRKPATRRSRQWFARVSFCPASRRPCRDKYRPRAPRPWRSTKSFAKGTARASSRVNAMALPSRTVSTTWGVIRTHECRSRGEFASIQRPRRKNSVKLRKTASTWTCLTRK